MAGRISRVTFYAHFPGKYALFEYTIQEVFKDRLRHHLPEMAPFTSQNVATLISVVCEFLRDTFRECPAPHGQMDSLMEKQIKAVVYEVLLSWLEELPQPDNSEQRAMITAWAIYGAAIQWSHKPAPQPVDVFVQEVLPIILSSLIDTP